MDKKAIRKKIIAERDDLDFGVKQSKDEIIINRFLDQGFIEKYDNIFCYVSFGSEIDNGKILSTILDSGKNLYVPYVDIDSRQMCLCQIHDIAEDLERGHYGILEPKKILRKPVNSGIIDCVISPGVAFTRKMERIGYGGGYYDRFYSSLKKMPFIVALAYDFQIVDSLPTESFDIPVDMIITETQIIK
ncbi:5-formyltetrahydrofolate cyclo-ligase [Lagierella sp. ICN-221743]|mgnify:CR=1 FL=1